GRGGPRPPRSGSSLHRHHGGLPALLSRRTTPLSSRGGWVTLYTRQPTRGPGLLQRRVRPHSSPAGGGSDTAPPPDGFGGLVRAATPPAPSSPGPGPVPNNPPNPATPKVSSISGRRFCRRREPPAAPTR